MRKLSRAEREHPASAHGSDACFLRWLTFQPSALSGAFSEWHDGVGRCVACHVRSVKAGAGTGVKPVFSAIPLTDKEHKLAHQKGDGHLAPPEWWEEQAEEHLQRWIDSRGRS